MSDEEKKAIEILKDNIKSLEGHTPFKHTNYKKVQAIETILNLIEKQSKEIEELKEKNEYLPSWVNKKYVSKDKIKAKIEEVCESTIEESNVDILYSLLEKE